MSTTQANRPDAIRDRPQGAVRLVLMRHAKSDYPPGVIDHERPLNDRGRRDAAAAGAWLRGCRAALLGEHPAVLVSSARRTQQTWAIAGADLDLPAVTEPSLYEAGDRAYRRAVGDALATASTVLVIGHNPATEAAARALAEPDDSDDHRALMQRFPTSAIAVIDLPDTTLQDGTGSLVAYVIPRG